MTNAKRTSQAPARGRSEARLLSRQDWVNYGFWLLGERGADGVRIDRLCAGLKVTKGSFYWHFKSRADFLEQMVQYWQYKETEAIIDEIEAQITSPSEIVNRLFEKANAGTVNFRAELAMRQWSIHDRTIELVVQTVDERRLDFIARQFRALGFSQAETRMRSRLIYSLIFGEALIQQPEPRHQRRSRWLASLSFILAPENAGSKIDRD